MYISLDRIDIELEAPQGQLRFLQTDTRTAAEIEARAGFSTIVGLVRCLNPRRMGGNVELLYYCEQEPPAFFQQLLQVSGSRLLVGEAALATLNHTEPPGIPDLPAVQQLLQAAIRDLAQEVVSRLQADDALSALHLLEAQLERDGFPEQDNEIGFWCAVLELAALAGAAISTANGGQWWYDPDAKGSLPLIYRCRFQGDTANVNPVGKAMKFIVGKGDGEEPSYLVEMLAAAP